MNTRLARGAAVLLACVLGFSTLNAADLSARGGSGSLSTPKITSVAPPVPVRDPAPQLLTITGTELLAGLTLEVMTPANNSHKFTGQQIQARRDTSFQVSVPLATAGAYSFVVTNVDGGMSEPFVVKVTTAAPVPTIDRTVPEMTAKSTDPQIVTVNGKGFMQGLTVSLTDPTGVVTRISGTAIAKISEESFEMSVVLDKPGEYSVMVTNPGGGSSHSVTIVVN